MDVGHRENITYEIEKKYTGRYLPDRERTCTMMTPEQRYQFDLNGYLILRDVVDPDLVQTIIQMMVDDDVYFAPTLVNFDRNFVKRNTPETEADPNLKYIPEEEPSFLGASGRPIARNGERLWS